MIFSRPGSRGADDTSMKAKTILIGLLFWAAHGGGAITAADYNQPGVPKVDITVESDLKVLAQGFVAAFGEIPAGAKYIWIRNGNETLVLGSIAWVKAYGGVLVIQVDSGPTHLVSAGDVIQITNDRPPSRN